MKKTLLALSILLCSTTIFAHEFWLQPLRFWLQANQQNSISIFVGEDYTGEYADGRKYKIFKLDHYSAKGKKDFKANVHDSDFSKIKASFRTKGNHLLAFNNSNKFIELESSRFNNYLVSEGLTNVQQMRMATNDTSKPGREFYQRCVKTLVKVGNKNDETYAINTGMKLELIPLHNPYAVADGASVTFKVLYENKPLKDALVLVWNVVDDKPSHTKYISNDAGEITFKLTTKGRWMVSTVRMVPHDNPAEADWQSYWGSYTFGYY